MLRQPPIVYGIVVTNGNNFIARTDSEFLFVRRPFNARRCAIDAQQYQIWNPLAGLV